ncbi:hypothetical protein [Candidatus Tisiphia endosymbiont of Dascillus cervinus]|uniref:hypothetical protein n=1 Tax=Candidatus Tisiphia endosymbiont of Dascillus cervinus TaxID=3066253 RepID=UPI00312C9FD0
MNIVVKKLVRVIIILNIIFIAEVTMASNSSSKETKDYIATSQYYHNLISSNDMAELNMFLSLLPKGGELHHHFSGAIYAENYLDLINKAGFCIDKNSYHVQKNKPNKLNKTCLSITALQDNYDLYTALLSRWSYGRFFYDHNCTQEDGLKHFFNVFGYVGPIEAVDVKSSLTLLKVRAKSENIQYIETILFLALISDNPALDKVNQLTSNTDDATINSVLSQAVDVLDKDSIIQNEIAQNLCEIVSNSKDIDDDDFSMRFQPYVVRFNNPSLIFSGLYSAFLMVKNNTKFVGVNIVGNEAHPIALRDYKLHMKMFRFLKQRFPNVKLSLHAGELTLGQVAPEELSYHINDAVNVAEANRIGHGVDIMHESNPYQLINTLLNKNILVEINLTSNEALLGVQGNDHPVRLYMQYGVPIAISTDDPGVSRNNLTDEYLKFVTRYKPSYDKLKEIVSNSIKYSFLTEDEKTKQIDLLNKKFIFFEDTIASFVKKHSHVKK